MKKIGSVEVGDKLIIKFDLKPCKNGMIAPFGNLLEFSKLYRCARRRNHRLFRSKNTGSIVFTMVQQATIVLNIRRHIPGMQSSMIAPFVNLVDLIELYQIPKRRNHRIPHPRNTTSNSEHYWGWANRPLVYTTGTHI